MQQSRAVPSWQLYALTINLTTLSDFQFNIIILAFLENVAHVCINHIVSNATRDLSVCQKSYHRRTLPLFDLHSGSFHLSHSNHFFKGLEICCRRVFAFKEWPLVFTNNFTWKDRPVFIFMKKCMYGSFIRSWLFF